MWCQQCQQDVPAITLSEVGAYGCPRCQTALTEAISHASSATSTEETPDDLIADPISDSRTEPPPIFDGWEMGEKLHHIERVLGVDKPANKSRAVYRIDAAHPSPARGTMPIREPATSQPDRKSSDSWHPFLTWTVLAVGLMATTCGGVLLIWSVASEGQDLWNLGMPITLGGQVVLLMGLVLQLDRIWTDHRTTEAKLDAVDHRLDDLHTTTSLLGTTHSSPSTSFYSHMAGGANSQLLLADLKSQLDLLTLKIGQEKR